MNAPKFLSSGDSAITVEFGNEISAEINACVHALDKALRKKNILGIVETVPTFRSLLIIYDPCITGGDKLKAKITKLCGDLEASSEGRKRIIEIPVLYGGEYGEDLKDVAEIFRGKAITEKNPTGSIGVVNISNILEYDIDYNSLDHLDEQERRVANYILKTDDLLLPARGTAIRTAVFNEQTYPCIASSNLIVIRPKSGALSGTYLKLFLDSAIGKKLIKSTQQGTAVMNISYRDLENIEIPYLPFEKQIEIAKKYQDGLAKYQETISSAEEKWQDTVRELEQNL